MKKYIAGLLIASIPTTHLMAERVYRGDMIRFESNQENESTSLAAENLMNLEIRELKLIERSLPLSLRQEIIQKDLENIAETQAAINSLKENGSSKLKLSNRTLGTLVLTAGAAVLATPAIAWILQGRYAWIELGIRGHINSLQEIKYPLGTPDAKRIESKIQALEVQLAKVNKKMMFFHNFLNKTFLRDFNPSSVDDLVKTSPQRFEIWWSKLIGSTMSGVAVIAIPFISVATSSTEHDELMLSFKIKEEIFQFENSIAQSKARLELLQTDLETEALEAEAAEIK